MNNVKLVHSNGFINDANSKINFLYFNARSLRKNFSKVNDFITQSKKMFQILLVTETWLYEDQIQYYNLSNYRAFHSTRESTRGGGVAIYVHQSFDSANLLGKKCWNGNDCLIVQLAREKLKVCLFYRQPSSSFDPSGSIFIDELNTFLASLNNAIVFGDFNLNIFESSETIEKYKDAVMLNNFAFLNSFSHEFPTRINYKNRTFSCIDHVFCDQLDSEFFQNCHMSYFDVVADHKALCISFDKKIKSSGTHEPVTIRVINNKKIKENKLLAELKPSNLAELANDLNRIIIANTMLIKSTFKARKPYVNSEILCYIHIKKNYEKLKKKFPLSLYVQTKWKWYRNKVSSLLNSAKKKIS